MNIKHAEQAMNGRYSYAPTFRTTTSTWRMTLLFSWVGNENRAELVAFLFEVFQTNSSIMYHPEGS